MSLERSFATNRNASSNNWTASSENWKVTFEEGGRLLAKNAGFIQTYICNQNLELHIQVFQSSICTYSAVVQMVSAYGHHFKDVYHMFGASVSELYLLIKLP